MKSQSQSKSKRRLSKTRRKSRKLRNPKTKSKTNKRNLARGHPHEDLEHYHLFIKFPRGNVNEIPETFLHSLKERNVKSVTVGDIEDYVKERFEYHGIDKSFTLFWRGKKLDDPKVKLRRIIVDGKKIPLYGRYVSHDDYLKVVYNETIENLSDVERHETVMDVSTPE
jgi:hypothetical protein